MTASSPSGYIQYIQPGQMPDYTRVGNAMRMITVDLTDAF
jgi:hypothetical protein